MGTGLLDEQSSHLWSPTVGLNSNRSFKLLLVGASEAEAELAEAIGIPQ
jgi:hypothetical protein